MTDRGQIALSLQTSNAFQVFRPAQRAGVQTDLPRIAVQRGQAGGTVLLNRAH